MPELGKGASLCTVAKVWQMQRVPEWCFCCRRRFGLVELPRATKPSSGWSSRPGASPPAGSILTSADSCSAGGLGALVQSLPAEPRVHTRWTPSASSPRSPIRVARSRHAAGGAELD